jgi:hypothetical protein
LLEEPVAGVELRAPEPEVARHVPLGHHQRVQGAIGKASRMTYANSFSRTTRSLGASQNGHPGSVRAYDSPTLRKSVASLSRFDELHR